MRKNIINFKQVINHILNMGYYNIITNINLLFLSLKLIMFNTYLLYFFYIFETTSTTPTSMFALF